MAQLASPLPYKCWDPITGTGSCPRTGVPWKGTGGLKPQGAQKFHKLWGGPAHEGPRAGSERRPRGCTCRFEAHVPAARSRVSHPLDQRAQESHTSVPICAPTCILGREQDPPPSPVWHSWQKPPANVGHVKKEPAIRVANTRQAVANAATGARKSKPLRAGGGRRPAGHLSTQGERCPFNLVFKNTTAQ